ncbi:MAG: hypothetical protein KF802_11510 [Bdellovibrionaceae bacterium]|nr:hypothetical protein [Pseudobdellovibrionaceae bacterium]
MSRWTIPLLMLLSAAVARAQDMELEESAPNEPPYTTPADEFGQTESAAGAPAVYSTHGNKSQFIRHPGAKKGLRLIDRDGAYYYETARISGKDQTSNIRVGMIKPPSILSADGTTSYTSMYGNGDPVTAMYDYEWKPLKAFGALGVQLGVGFFTAQGQGRFVQTPGGLTSNVARERYTFYAIPMSLGAVYRFQYMDDQWIAPYVSGGATYYALVEDRDDGMSTNFVGTPAFYGAGGLMINLSTWDRETRYILDAEYGIHTLWLTAEARQIQSASEELDFSGLMISVGISVDY